MITISITHDAFAAIVSTLPGSETRSIGKSPDCA
jgi:hypothetical protein